MNEPTPLSMLKEDVDRLEGRIDRHGEQLAKVSEELTVVPVMKRAFYWLAVVITGAIIAVIGAAVTIILSTGGPR